VQQLTALKEHEIFRTSLCLADLEQQRSPDV
jgi:hypothetical protein